MFLKKINSKSIIKVLGFIVSFTPIVAQAQNSAQSFSIAGTVASALAGVAGFIFNVVSWVTAKMAVIMDWTIEFFILEMSSKVQAIDAINVLWRLLRDLGNMVFIFLILFAAIAIILDLNNYNPKQILVRVVVVALFVNFSLFVTQVVIDTSNVFTLQIYQNISVDGFDASKVNISNAIAGQLNLSTLQSPEGLEAIRDNAGTEARLALLRLLSAGVIGLLGFVFAAFAALISIRFFVLLVLMIGSPIAFIAMAIPNIDFGKQWWDWLISQSFFAPAVMLMLYITLYLGNGMRESDLFSGDMDLAKAIIDPGGSVDILVFYITMIGMLIAALLVAKQMGAIGADKAVSYGENIRDWGQAKIRGAKDATVGAAKKGAGMAARGAVGYTGRKIDENVFKGSRFAKTYAGKQIRKGTTGKMKGASFGTGTSYEDVREAKKEAERDVESYERKEKAKQEFEREDATRGQKRRALKELSAKERAEFIKSEPEERAGFASQSDIDKLESHDDFSEEDVRKVKQHRYDLTGKESEGESYEPSEILEAVRSGDSDTIEEIEKTIKSNLEFVSNNEIKENVNVNLDEDASDEEEAVRRMTIQAMSPSQIDSFMENKTSDERDVIKEDISDILERKINSNDIESFLDDMDPKQMARYLKNAESDVREKDEIIEQIDEKVVSELQGELSTGEQESLREAVLDRATRPGTTTTDKNRRAAEHLEFGPGAAT